MDFLIQWLSYLAAFVAGSAIAWGIATVLLQRGDDLDDRADSGVTSDAPESPAIEAP